MANKINLNKQQLIAESREMISILLSSGTKNVKILFIDSSYGKMFKAQHTKIDNLWSGKSADKDFNNKLKKYVEKNSDK